MLVIALCPRVALLTRPLSQLPGTNRGRHAVKRWLVVNVGFRGTDSFAVWLGGGDGDTCGGIRKILRPRFVRSYLSRVTPGYLANDMEPMRVTT